MLRDEIAKYTELSGNDGEHTPIGIIGAYLDGYDKGLELSASKNPNKWIPVSERLPEKKVKDYLACCEDGYVATIMYDNGRWLINGNNVIAWMPLPEPYHETCKDCLEPCIMYEPDMRACKKKVREVIE